MSDLETPGTLPTDGNSTSAEGTDSTPAISADTPAIDATDDGPVSRRSFVSKAAVGIAGAGALAACGPGAGGEGGPAVQTGQRVTWRLASSYPRSLDTIFGAGEVLAETVSAMTGGRFTIRVYPAGELVPAFGVMDAVQQGTVQCCHTTSYYFVGKSQALAFAAAVPFGFTPRQQNAWMAEGGGLELMRRAYADFNIINFPSGNTGGQMGGWFRREVNTAQDLQGLKMRIPGLGGQVMDRLGVAVQNIPGGEIYPALERGAIDATEWVGPYDDEKLGLHQAATYYYYPGWWEPGPNMSCLVNQDAWASLSSEYQAIFETACHRAHNFMQQAYDGRNPAALQRLVAGGTQLRRFSPEIMSVASAASEQLMEDNANADPFYREVYENWKQFRDLSNAWFGTTEFAYADFAFGNRNG